MERYKCVNLNYGPVAANETVDWQPDNLVVPPLPATGLMWCNIIELEHFVEVRGISVRGTSILDL